MITFINSFSCYLSNMEIFHQKIQEKQVVISGFQNVHSHTLQEVKKQPLSPSSINTRRILL